MEVIGADHSEIPRKAVMPTCPAARYPEFVGCLVPGYY